MGLICTTNDRDFGPTRIKSPWDVLSSSLRKELGPEFELLLAKPLPHDGKTDWYTDIDAPAVQFAALGPAQRSALAARLDGMRRQVLAYADRLVAPNVRGRDPQTAKDLQLAMRIDERHVWSVNGQPLLVAWGLEPPEPRWMGEGGLVEILRPPGRQWSGHENPSLDTGGADAGPTAPVAIANVGLLGRVPWALPLWLFFFGLVGASYFLLLQGCAFSSTGAGAWLARNPSRIPAPRRRCH